MLELELVREIGKKVASKIYYLDSPYNQPLINELRLKMILYKYEQDIPKNKFKNI